MDKYIVVDRVETNRSDVTFLTEDNSVVLVSVYGSGVGFLSNDTVIGIAREELKRKIDSDYFCLVTVRLSERRQKQFDFMTPLPSDGYDFLREVNTHVDKPN
jgi:hypothetical protein